MESPPARPSIDAMEAEAPMTIMSLPEPVVTVCGHRCRASPDSAVLVL